MCAEDRTAYSNTLCLKIQLESKVIDSKMKSKPIDSVTTVADGKEFETCRQNFILIPSTTAHNASEDAGVISITPQITPNIDSNFVCVCVPSHYSNYFCLLIRC